MRLTGRRWLSIAAVVAASASVAACSSSGSSPSSGSGTSTESSAGVTKAQQMVSQLESTTTAYPVPSASVSGVSKFAGRTVYYIPLVAAIPGFVVTAATMKTALAKAGLKLQVCDGQGNPTTIASCVNQAEGANAAGIVLDAIPYGMAANALGSAKTKGIPVIVADQYAPSGTTNSDSLSYVQGVVDQPSQIAWWVIANSGGKANIIIGEENDSQSSVQYVQNSLPIYKQYCPGCKVTVKAISATTDKQLVTQVSANIQSVPGADYYYTEFEDSLQDTVSGIQAAGKQSSIDLTVAGGSINGLGLLKQGTDLKAVVCVDQAYAGWALTDEALRMMTKSGPVTETFPSRLFSATNIGSVQVTSAAQASGTWFGDSSYQSQFAKLWGVG